jgi:plastocyanin
VSRALFTILAAAMLATGCSDAPEGEPAEAAAAVTAEPAAPAPTGTIIEVRMITDDRGNYFEPAEIEAKRGDVLRLVLVSGVHNLHFLPDSNPAGAVLPPATEMLQLPGQTVDVPVTMAAGEYYFQCDPHALLGMVGTLEVED